MSDARVAQPVIAPPSDASPNVLARVAGALYLLNVLAGAYAIGYVQTAMFGSDPTATVATIQSHELLYRSGLAAHVVVTVTNVPLAVIFYELFKHVNRRLALLDAFLILVATAVEAAGLVALFAPLAALGSTGAATVSGEQQEALVWVTGYLAQMDYAVFTVFFGLDILCLSYLAYRSGLLPRTIAVLLAVDGLGYLVYSFTVILAPSLAAPLTPWIQLPAPLAEGALSLWLLVFGLTADRRIRRAGRPGATMRHARPGPRRSDRPVRPVELAQPVRSAGQGAGRGGAGDR